MSVEHKKLLKCLIDEKRGIYDEIMRAISIGKGGMYFLYGHGVTRKTYMWRTLCASIRFKCDIVLPVASSDNASLLFPIGSTAHSRFEIPLNVTQDSMCRGVQPVAI